MAVAPIRKTVANRVCAKSSFASRCWTCSTSTNRSLPNAALIHYVSRCCFGCLFAPDGGIFLPDSHRQNSVLHPRRSAFQKLALGLLNILARPIYTKHLQLCCIKHVTGLFVSRLFNNRSAPVLHRFSTNPPNTDGRYRRSRAATCRLDTFTPKVANRRREGEGGRRVSADASSVSRCADIVRPGCSREVVTKRRYTTRNNQNFTSEKYAKPLAVDFRRRNTTSNFWESTSATRWDEGRTDREGYRGTA
jgi:hypothetical protein